ncbi:hypothetical protein KSX_89320 [Ktedonospora formicarum]|uniref:Arginase n=2 Tax=Ktedonospora formicarum TaxID=2778364 RepID=A0A8J3IGJ7_9CHLR|nr:hypothetical protein KSX_89320 [Ktedonospora formicarum]
MLALRRIGRYGLIFIDGHLDFRHPGNAEALGGAAGEDLALVTGRGGSTLANLEGWGPLVVDSDVVAIGFRSDDEYATEAQQIGMTTINAAHFRQKGPAHVACLAQETFKQRSIEGYWIHLDADVLDPALMPAVDTPTPGGLTIEELTLLLKLLLRTNLAIGLEVTVFDPDLDPDGKLASCLADIIIAALGSEKSLATN